MRRKGVLLVMFDVPSKTPSEKKKYRDFVKNLIKDGYVRFQESVFVKLLRNTENVGAEMIYLKSISPEDGKVSALPMGLIEFKKLRVLQGVGFDVSFFSDDVIIS